MSGEYSLIYISNNLFAAEDKNLTRDMLSVRGVHDVAGAKDIKPTLAATLIINDNLFLNCKSSLVNYVSEALAWSVLNYSALSSQ